MQSPNTPFSPGTAQLSVFTFNSRWIHISITCGVSPIPYRDLVPGEEGVRFRGERLLVQAAFPDDAEAIATPPGSDTDRPAHEAEMGRGMAVKWGWRGAVCGSPASWVLGKLFSWREGSCLQGIGAAASSDGPLGRRKMLMPGWEHMGDVQTAPPGLGGL